VISASDALHSLGDGAIYVTQAHDVVEPKMHAGMLEQWQQVGSNSFGLIAAQRRTSYFPGGYLAVEGERVTGVVEKPGAGNEPSDLVNLVDHLFASWRDLLAAIENEAKTPGADDAYERALSRLMTTQPIRAHVYEGRWQALKYPWHMLDVMDMLLDLWR